MIERPTYSKWSRKVGGYKLCRECGHKHPPVMKVDGRAQRVRQCVRCGADLPKTLTYPKRAQVKWFVREFDSNTGKQRDIPCRSSEDADERIRQLQRDYTADPIQQGLLEYTSVLIRQIQAVDRNDGINQLIAKLGGDATVRSLKPVEWSEAIETICTEMKQKGRSDAYVADVRRVATDFGIVTGETEWSRVSLDTIAKYRRVRMEGGWKRGKRTVKAVKGRAINKDLATISAFLSRGVRKGWVAANVLEGARDERIKVSQVRVRYMPDEDLRAIVKAASERWMRTLIQLAYYTGARRGDLLRLEWDRDVDLNGKNVEGEGRTGPHVFIRGNKADTPHWMPLHPVAVEALRKLRREPVIDRKVFPVRGSRNPASRVSQLFAAVCRKAGLVREEVDRDGNSKNLWSLHDLRRKANTDLRNRGASAKERCTLLGHKGTAVNEANYEAVIPARERELIDSLPQFGVAG